MSYTIDNLSFTIFGNGHDYTLLDSGDGEIQIFSHPFVPLNSVNYAGQYFFVVADENGEPMDAVKDDIAHITFDPPLGTAFDTEGEVTVKAHYHREYITLESTTIVDKEVEQTITVVDHGAVVTPAGVSFNVYYCSDIYEDGYAFLHPYSVTTLEDVEHCQPRMSNDIRKVSSIFWRTESIGHYHGFLRVTGLDPDGLEELKYADTSRVTKIRGLVCENYTTDVDLTPVEGWDTSNVTDLSELLYNCYAQTNLKGLEGWDVSNVTNLDRAFLTNKSLTDISAIADWDVGNVTTMERIFDGCAALASLEDLAYWDVSKVESMASAFSGTTSLTALDGLESWDVSSLTDITQIFYRSGIESAAALATWTPHITDMIRAFNSTQLRSFVGLERFDVSAVTDMSETFAGNGKLLSADGLETWDVSNVTNFFEAFFGDPWLEDISALADWDTSSATSMNKMFGNTASILDPSPLNDWDFSNADVGGMFVAFTKYYSPTIDKDVWANGVGYYFDYDGKTYGAGGLGEITEYVKDATSAQNWSVTGTGLGAFNTPVWINVPTWN